MLRTYQGRAMRIPVWSWSQKDATRSIGLILPAEQGNHIENADSQSLMFEQDGYFSVPSLDDEEVRSRITFCTNAQWKGTMCHAVNERLVSYPYDTTQHVYHKSGTPVYWTHLLGSGEVTWSDPNWIYSEADPVQRYCRVRVVSMTKATGFPDEIFPVSMRKTQRRAVFVIVPGLRPKWTCYGFIYLRYPETDMVARYSGTYLTESDSTWFHAYSAVLRKVKTMDYYSSRIPWSIRRYELIDMVVDPLLTSRQYTIPWKGFAGRLELEAFLRDLGEQCFPDNAQSLVNDVNERWYSQAKSFDGNMIAYVKEAIEMKRMYADLVDSQITTLNRLLKGGSSHQRSTAKTTACILAAEISNSFLANFYGTRLTIRDTEEIISSLTRQRILSGRIKASQECEVLIPGNLIGEGTGDIAAVFTRTYEVFPKNRGVEVSFDLRKFLFSWDGLLTYENMWDLIPYSFVVDWFVGLQSTFRSIDINIARNDGLITAYGALDCWKLVIPVHGGDADLSLSLFMRAPTKILRSSCILPEWHPEVVLKHLPEATALAIQRIL